MWQKENDQLYQKFEFDSFDEAVVFVNACSGLAKKHNQFPTWKQHDSTVEVWIDASWPELADSVEKLAQKLDSAEVEDKNTTSVISKLTDAKLYTDGGSRGNPGPSACAHVILDMSDAVVEKGGSYIGITTNNQAEYQALFRGLERAKEMGIQNLDVYMDSLLVVNQMKGIFKVKNRDLWPVYESTKNFCANFRHVSFNHVPREYNKIADEEVNRILDEQ